MRFPIFVSVLSSLHSLRASGSPGLRRGSLGRWLRNFYVPPYSKVIKTFPMDALCSESPALSS